MLFVAKESTPISSLLIFVLCCFDPCVCLQESENAAESMKQLIRDQYIQIVELKKELEVLNSCCSSKNIPVTEDTSIDQDDSVSSGQAGRSLVSLSNKPNLGSYDASVDNFHVSKRYFNTQNRVYLSDYHSIYLLGFLLGKPGW